MEPPLRPGVRRGRGTPRSAVLLPRGWEGGGLRALLVRSGGAGEGTSREAAEVISSFFLSSLPSSSPVTRRAELRREGSRRA